MAISLGFGIVFATGVILLRAPCLHLMLEDLVQLCGVEAQETEAAWQEPVP